ncbi:RNA ligase [Actinokineospora enzanensis]|uniref:RNA ligase n=1 Tax=Actinokineospora enzanensis TaxID=155975 RepID=UPI0003697E50|nr:RNA ligase [Actinokineospora enzanensis]
MHLHDLFSQDDLDWHLSNGYVRFQLHPDQPYLILNYTEKTQATRHWTPVTRACRGLIIHDLSQEIVARPLAKFFNYGEEKGGKGLYDPSASVVVSDKMDGSLGILYPNLPHIGGHSIATRGSFTSVQAEHATQIWNERYANRFTPPAGITMLFEIIYPDNRIVVDYNGLDDLVFLGYVDNDTGLTFGPHSLPGWPGLRAKVFEFATLRDALDMPPRPNSEGLVVHFVNTDRRIKLKQDDYTRLHRIVTGLNERSVWETLSASGNVDDLMETLPDEFHTWVHEVAGNLYASFNELDQQVRTRWADLDHRGLVDGDRREYALAITDESPLLRACLFARLDWRPYEHLIWKHIKPRATR